MEEGFHFLGKGSGSRLSEVGTKLGTVVPTKCRGHVLAIREFRKESWQNGYCTGLENRRPQGLGGSNPSLSAKEVECDSLPSSFFPLLRAKSANVGADCQKGRFSQVHPTAKGTRLDGALRNAWQSLSGPYVGILGGGTRQGADSCYQGGNKETGIGGPFFYDICIYKIKERFMGGKIGILGSAMVGQALANGFAKQGYDVMIGTNTPSKKDDLKTKLEGKAKVGSFEETAKFGDIIVLATKGAAAESALKAAGFANLAGKTVVDTTNPIADAPPVNGVLQYFTSLSDSLMERLQKLVPSAHFVKAFSSVGNAFMVNPDFGGIKPTMFICGNNDVAKRDVKGILDKFGWEVEDMGAVEAARAIEPLCILWCIPGFRENRWAHAFKLLKK